MPAKAELTVHVDRKQLEEIANAQLEKYEKQIKSLEKKVQTRDNKIAQLEEHIKCAREASAVISEAASELRWLYPEIFEEYNR